MASPTSLRGINVALITPFTDNGKKVDFAALDAHINRMIDAGVHGLVPGGSTGEFTVLTPQERKEVLEQVCKSAAGRAHIMAGIGDLSTSGATDLAAHAAKAGAHSLMVVPPYYDALNLEQLREMLAAVRDASGGLPLVYYNIPSASGLTLSAPEIASLSDVGVTHLKDTSGDAPKLTELLFDRACNTRVTAFNGWDTLTFYGLAAGAKGSVWGTTNVIPELSMQLWDALAVRGDLVESRALWDKIYPICKFLESHNYASAVKTGVELRGWSTGGLRKPFSILNDDLKKELAGLLKAAGVKVVE